MSWEYLPHQIQGAKWALQTIREYGLAYLAWKERTRKTGTALLTAEMSKASTVLVITKKKAIKGWEQHLENLPLTKNYTIINYESVHKVYGDFDFIILDEAHHAISSFPKPSQTWKNVAKLTVKKPILYLSATPYAEHLGLIYHQLRLSSWTPLKFKNGYDFFRAYGVSNKTRTPYGLVETYTKFKDAEILGKILHLFDFKTRQDVGIEFEPTANVVKVPLTEVTRLRMVEWVNNRILKFGKTEVIGDTDAKMRTIHYQLEGGTIKTPSSYLVVGSEKLDYIRKTYDLDKIAIMAHFIAERDYLKNALPNVPILSADGDAEGVDLSHIDKLIIYSMSFRTSKHTQRLARQANHNRTTPIVVDVLVCDRPAIGYEVYKTVALKEANFTKNSYERVI